MKPAEIDGTGRKLLAIYMVGSDLEEDNQYGSTDLWELLTGYARLPNPERVEVVVAFGGARKEGWRGMKFANISQLAEDLVDKAFGNEPGPDAYLYRADGANMGDESSLKLFLDYLRDGYVNFDQRFLTLWDHGGSYLGFGDDTNFNKDGLSLREIDNAFRNSRSDSFDLIGFDACLMASVEVARFVAPHADYMMASEELEPGHGWLWSAVIEEYAREDTIVEVARGMVDNFVQDVHEYPSTGKTLSLVDLSRYDDLVAALNPVLSAYGDRLLTDSAYGDSLVPATARAESYNYSPRAGYRTSMDLMHFVQLLGEDPPNSETESNLERLVEALENFVVHSNHDGSRPNSFGIAIDAPENADQEYSSYKVSDTWTDFQKTYEQFRLNDSRPPVIKAEYWNTDGTWASVHDENLATVTSVYGFVQPVEIEDAPEQDFFMVVAEEEAHTTEVQGEYFAPVWDQVWFTVEYDPDKNTAWIPAYFSRQVEEDGLDKMVFTAEIDYYQSGKDYSDQEFPFDWANLSLIVHDDGEEWKIVDHYVQTYQVLFSGPDDKEGTIQFDKATHRVEPGDRLEFWNFGFNLVDSDKDGWFPTADGVVTFVQKPVFLFEFFEFEDESGDILDYYYAISAEDASGNLTLGERIQSEPVVDSPFGSMLAYRNPAGAFEVQMPQPWTEEEPDAEQTEVFRASDPGGNGTVIIYSWEFAGLSLAEYADDLESWFIETGATDLTRKTVTTAQGVPAVRFEGLSGQEAFTWLAHVSDGVGVEVVYWFPIDQMETGRELAYHSFDTLLVH